MVRTFLSTPSARRATKPQRLKALADLISIHALREEGDDRVSVWAVLAENFYPRPPRGGRPKRRFTYSHRLGISIHALREEGDPRRLRRCLLPCHFYPRPPRGGRPMSSTSGMKYSDISIHALREEGDIPWARSADIRTDFYPRPPRGGRPVCSDCSTLLIVFLSTPSARRATCPPLRLPDPCMISIHALREEGDRFPRSLSAGWWYFYPRPPRGGRRCHENGQDSTGQISIHALREEGDRSPWPPPPGTAHFYPRPPRGGRHSRPCNGQRHGSFLSTPSARRATGGKVGKRTMKVFLSTPSARRATQYHRQPGRGSSISIHALREEGDPMRKLPISAVPHFYPRPPRGGRPA